MIDEADLVARALENDPDAVTEFRDQMGPTVRAALIRRAPDHARWCEDVVAEVLTDCLVPADPNKPPLLRLWRGGSLSAFLIRCATFRLINALRKKDQQHLSLDDQSTGGSLLTPATESGPPSIETEEVAQLLGDALEYAFAEVGQANPLGFVFLRLHTVYGLRKQTLARLWDRHPSQAGRYITEAADAIRTTVERYLRQVDPQLEFNWEDLLGVAQQISRKQKKPPQF